MNVERRVRVQDVETQSTRLPQQAMGALLSSWLGGETLATSHPGPGICVDGVHPLLAAARHAYAEHLPLALSPDHIWTTILQGARMCEPDPTPLLPKHLPPGLDLTSRTQTWLDALPPALTFSTTDAATRSAQVLAHHPPLQQCSDHVTVMMCGIPYVVLQGTTQDWRSLQDHVRSMTLPTWWAQDLQDILTVFVETAEGEEHGPFWSAMFHIGASFQGDHVQGWLLTLFPFLRDPTTGLILERNPMLLLPTTSMETPCGPQLSHFPLGLSETLLTDRDEVLTLRAGFLGVRQRADAVVEPILGWALSNPPLLHKLLTKVELDHVTSPSTHVLLERSTPKVLIELYSRWEHLTLHPGSAHSWSLCSMNSHREFVLRSSYIRAFRFGSAAGRSLCCARVVDANNVPEWWVFLVAGELGRVEIQDTLVIANDMEMWLEHVLSEDGEYHFEAQEFEAPRSFSDLSSACAT